MALTARRASESSTRAPDSSDTRFPVDIPFISVQLVQVNEETVHNRKFRLAFASNTIRSPAYPTTALAVAYRENNYDVTWGRSKEEKAVSLAFPKGVVPRVAYGFVDAHRQVASDPSAKRHFANTLSFQPESDLLDKAEASKANDNRTAARIYEQRAEAVNAGRRRMY